MSTSLTPSATHAAIARVPAPATAPHPGAADAPHYGDQLARSLLPLAFAWLGALLYGAYLLGALSANRSDWPARLLLACFTLPGVMQGSAAVRALVARHRGAPAPGWWRIAGHAIRAAGGVVLAFTLVALPPHTALYIGTSAVVLTLGETAWSLTEARAAWRGLRGGRPLERAARLRIALGLLLAVGAPLGVAAWMLLGAPAAAERREMVRARARELPVRATLETAVASIRDTRARMTEGLPREAAMLAPYPFDTVGLAADLARRPAPGVRLAYWTTPGGGFIAAATRADGSAKCVASLFPGTRRELWCDGDAGVPALFAPLLRRTATVPPRAWHWEAP